MKKSVLYLLPLVFALNACSTNELQSDSSTVEAVQKDPLTARQINTEINSSLKNTGDFNWKNASDHLLWSAVFRGNKMVSIGFGADKDDFDRKLSANSREMEDEILNIIRKSEGKERGDALISSDQYLNQIDVLIEKQETLTALRQMKTVRYVEPADYHYFEYENELNTAARSSGSSGSGCGFESKALNTADYTATTPNAKIPWAFAKHNIPNAWNYSTGAGITIGLVDTGVSSQQSLLGSSFNSGSSSGRTITKYGTYVNGSSTDGPNDQCGHGTKMAAVMASPKNNSGLPVGVAYNASLVTYRAAANVLLDTSSEQDGVKKAFTDLANNTSVKIISMSMGHLISVGKIEDGVKYAYSKGKLIFCAGGTSTSITNFDIVIFPARMSEVQAVTGVKEGTSNQKCDICHSGSQIDFTFQMERSSGSNVPVLSYYNGQADYVGGSSVATAATAGIAALVWSKHPSWTRDQVLNKMRQSSTYSSSVNSNYGYGNINALQAVQ
ncbi:MAG: S8/S53 family peptidase [Chryseobacterium sp.]|jgi:subtilisin family serine protease|uniref:S8 family peptidase n=1 Tax=Chryseobacterium sp. TaxID=1871047 RepID=UPI002828A044|nr:S8/S53 family peptidase [Chryseobacterium sp.]MDR2236694.1 S8/S53 family peptidase [Chryseobacterium sp.]